MQNPVRQLHLKKKDLIAKINRENPEAIQYPAYFNVIYWREQGFLLSLTPIEVEGMKYAPSPESAPRLVRKQVQDGLIKRSEKQTKRNAQLASDSTKALSKPILEPAKSKEIRIVWDNANNRAIVYQ